MQRTQQAASARGAGRQSGDRIAVSDTGVASTQRPGAASSPTWAASSSMKAGRGISWAPRLSRCGVAIWQSIIRNPRAGSSSQSRLSATFEASRSMLNIDSPKNTRAERHAVEPADQALAFPGLDRVREAEPVELEVGGAHLRRQPRAARPQLAAAARTDDVAERRVQPCHISAVAHRLGEAARDAQLIRKQHGARVRAPPQDRLTARVPGEDAASIGGEQPGRRQVTAGGEQSVRLAQRAVHRRKRVRRIAFGEPDDRAAHSLAGRASARLLLEWSVLLHLPHVFVHCRPLLIQIAVDRAPEARIRDPVRRPGLRAARSRAAPCARPACRARIAAGPARYSTRFPGNSTSRNAGCETPRPRPSSGRRACRRRGRKSPPRSACPAARPASRPPRPAAPPTPRGRTRR